MLRFRGYFTQFWLAVLEAPGTQIMYSVRQLKNSSVVFLPALLVMAAATAKAGEGAQGSAEKEAELVAVLRSDAPGGEKAIACKLLAIHGSKEAVPELARLLPDEKLASWARIALEAIPDPAADEALRKATDSVQ